MGTWGASNFQEDKALDYLATDIVGPLVRKLEALIANPALAEPDERAAAEIMVAVEVLSLLCESCNAAPPKPALVKKAADTYLRVWDGSIDRLQPDPDFKRERRRVLETSFARLHQVASDWYQQIIGD